MRNPFLPENPFISPSINRVKLLALPGLTLPENVIGKFGYELLSAAALVEQIRQQADLLNLDPKRPDLIMAFDDCFTAVSTQVVEAARVIAVEYGQTLGYLLLTLKQGNSASRVTRPEWDDRHWAWWGKINTIWLGGGLVSGNWGALIAEAAQSVVQNAGFPEFVVNISPFGGNISLAGAANLVPSVFNTALVFDFGHTQVKRAVAIMGPDRLVRLDPLPALPAPCERYEYHGWSPEQSPQVLAGMLTAVAESWSAAEEMGYALDPIMVIGLACYLIGGHPLPAHLETGCYARLQVLSENLERLMNEQIAAVLGQSIQVKLVHDATAAALAYTGWQDTAVITIGTSLGIGFPPTNL